MHACTQSSILYTRWRCPVGSCKKSVSLHAGTFFENTRISLQKLVLLMYWWVQQFPVTQAATESEVATGTAVDVYQWLREICSWRLINHDDMMLGGSSVYSKVVEIDESCFSHKPKVCNMNSCYLLDIVIIHFIISVSLWPCTSITSMGLWYGGY